MPWQKKKTPKELPKLIHKSAQYIKLNQSEIWVDSFWLCRYLVYICFLIKVSSIS